MKKVFIIILLSIFPNFLLANDNLAGRLIDLTHSFDEETIYWPTEDGFRLENEIFGITVNQIPLEQLIGPGVMVDVTQKSQSNKDYQVTVKGFKVIALPMKFKGGKRRTVADHCDFRKQSVGAILMWLRPSAPYH
jgi:kynurenine formamidase